MSKLQLDVGEFLLARFQHDPYGTVRTVCVVPMDESELDAGTDLT